MEKRNVSGIQKLIFVLSIVIAILLGGLISLHHLITGIGTFVIIFIVGWLLAGSIGVANQWEKALVLRLGKFKKLAM